MYFTSTACERPGSGTADLASTSLRVSVVNLSNKKLVTSHTLSSTGVSLHPGSQNEDVAQRGLREQPCPSPGRLGSPDQVLTTDMASAEDALPTEHVYKAMDTKNAWECRPRIGPLRATGPGGGSEFMGECGALDEFDDATSMDNASSSSEVALARAHDGQAVSFTTGIIADTTRDQSVDSDVIGPCSLGDRGELTPRRLEAVQLYCRDEDPLFVRANLKRLLKGKLERLFLGDIVNVARRCRGGDRRHGGEGHVVQVLPGLFYDIKYAVGGIEKGVDACFVERIAVGRRPRESTPRCPDCNCFLHECLCPGVVKPLTAAIVETGASSTYPHGSSAKRPRVDPGGRLKEMHARSPPREQLSGVTKTVGGDDGVGRTVGACTPGKGDTMGIDGDGHVRDIGEACAPGGNVTTVRHRGDQISGSDTGRDDTGLVMAERGTADSGGVDGASAPHLLHGSTAESRSTGSSQHEEHAERERGNRSSGDQGSDARRHEDREQHTQGEGETAIWRQDDRGESGISGDMPAVSSSGDRGSVDKGKSGQSAPRRGPAVGEDGRDAEVQSQSGRCDAEQPDNTGEWQHRKGDLVEVERRMTPGINKPGGTARVVRVDAVSGSIDVRYVVEGGWERGIHPMYVRPAKLDMSEMKRPTLGRCGHCGSLRVDCKQECDYYMSLRRPRRARQDPVSSLLPLDVPYHDEEASSQGRRNFGRSRESGEPALDAERSDRRKARRHLPDDWDDEGVSMFGSEEEQSTGARGDFDWDEGMDSEGSNVRLSTSWTPGVLDTQRGASVSENPSTDGGRSDTDDSSESTGADVDPLRGLSSHIGRNRSASDSQSDIELLRVRSGSRSNGSRVPRESPTANGGAEGPDSRAVRRSRHTSGHDYSPLSSESLGMVAWDDVDVGDAGEEGTARFLMPEGEEASRMLPSDIVDPTRGVTDPAVLREELIKFLEKMENRDAEELEKDVPALSRRAAQATAANQRSGHGSVVGRDLLSLQARIRQVLRRLDIANNIFVRLEKKDARWREGIAGENAWHRLDRMTVRLEEWRRDVDKALREYERSWPVDERLSEESSNSLHRDLAGDDSSASPASAGEYSRAVPREHSRHMGLNSEENLREGVDLERTQGRTAGGMSKSRSSVVRGDDDESLGVIGSSEAGGNGRGMNGHSRGRNYPLHDRVRSRNRKRPRQAMGTGRTTPQHGTAKARKAQRKNGAPSGADNGGYADRRATLPLTSDNLEERYIPGLDYRMAADSGSDEHCNIGLVRVRSSSESSAPPSSPSSPWPSHSDPGPLLQLAGENVVSPDEEASGGTRALDGGRVSPPEVSYLGSSAWPGQGQRAAGASFGSAADRRSISRATRKGSRKNSERSGARRHERSSRARTRRVSIPSEGRYREDIRGHREARGGKLRWAEETLFRQRLAEQEARGGGLYARDGSNAGTRRQEYAGFPEERAEPAGSADGHATGETSAEPVRLTSFVEDLLPKPRFGDVLVFKTLRAATLNSTEVHLGGMVLRAGDCDHASWGQAGDDEQWADVVRRRRIKNAGSDTAKDADSERSAREDADVGERQDATSGASIRPMNGGDEDRETSCDVFIGRRRGGCLSRLQSGDGNEEPEDEGLRGSAGKMERALCLLPQQMADLEELAKLGYDDEAKTLARACCKVMAVVSANLRVLVSIPTLLSSSSSSSGVSLRGFRAICAVTRQVKQLAEGAAPGRSGEGRGALGGLKKDSEDEDGSPSCSPWPGLSLTDAVSLQRKLRGSRGSNALVGACAAFHSHMLEWFAVTGMFQREATKILAQRGGPDAAPVDENESLSGTAPSPKEGDARRLPTPNLPVRLLEFSRSLLLDLLFLFEKHPPAWPKVSREQELGKDPLSGTPSLTLPRKIARDPLCELWYILMDTLDGVRGLALVHPPAVANVTVPEFSRPLIGFWGVFYSVVSGGVTHSSRQTDTGLGIRGADDGDGDDEGTRVCGWGLPSELVWRIVLHAVRLQLLREGWGDSTAGARGIESQAEGEARAAAFRNRRRETSRPLWQCVRLLLAASPFALEFSGSKEGPAVSANALAAMASTRTPSQQQQQQQQRPGDANALAKTELRFGCSGKTAAVSTELRAQPPLLTVAEAGTSPGMVARILLERIVVLARVCPPEPGPQGLIENIWKGVQRISVSLCGVPMSSGSGARGHAETEDGDEPGGRGEQREDVEARRLRSGEKISDPSPVEAESLGRLLSYAVRAWCLPVHNMCRLPRATLERNREEGRHLRRAEGDYEALCSLTSLLTQEFAMRLPEGLKRRRLANALLKAKYSSSGPDQVSSNDDDDLHVLAPSRVLLGIALGLGRAGLGVDAAKEIVKAAAIRPRNVSADAPRDHPIALAAPAATALCLALPSQGTDDPDTGDRGGRESARAALFGVLDGCMKDALRLLARVLDEAGRLGQAVCPQRLERPKAAVGLVASCILVALRHIGPRAGFRRPSFDLASARAAEPFLEGLGRALDKRFANFLGRPACTVILSALFHCLPSVAQGASTSLSVVASSASAEASGEAGGNEHVSAGVERGYAMGWWKRTYPGADMGDDGHSEQHMGSSSAGPLRANGGVEGIPRNGVVSQGAETGENQPEPQEDENRDEYGSWDGFADDAELDALLSGRTDDPAEGSQSRTERGGTAQAAEDEATLGVEEPALMERVLKEEELWRCLANGVAINILPHLPDILKRAWTMARYAQSGSSSSVRAGTVEATRDDSMHRPLRTFRGGESGHAIGAVPSAAPSPCESPVDAGVVLMLHASAALVLLRGSFAKEHGDNSRPSGNHAQAVDFASVREKYLDLNHAAQHPFVPQQRLLAPAFFCLMLSKVTGEEDRCLYGSGDVRGLSDLNRQHSPPSVRAPVHIPRPRMLLRETLRGREWDVLHIWIQAALDPATFPLSRRGDRPRRPGRSGRGGAIGKGKEPSDLVRDGFQDFTRGLGQAFRSCGGLEVEGSGTGGWGGMEPSDPPLLDGDLADALEKRLTRFDPGTLSQLTSEEYLVLERVLDVQSVMAHCGELWATALVIAAPALLCEADRKRLKDRVIKLVHFSVKTLRRFLSEVFPRERGGHGALGSRDKAPRLYGSTFRRLYGHTAYALVAFLTRMCGGALKGPPLRDLVETSFEGIASRSVGAKDGSEQDRRDGAGVASGTVAAGTVRGRGEPHRELTSLAVMHASDLLVCFSEMPMTVAPVAEWVKNINDHAINGSLSSVSDSSSCREDATLVPPLIRSLAAGLRGELRYPSPACTLPPLGTSGKIDFVRAMENIALAPPPRTPRTVLAKEQILARMRLEILGDRKLRIARFLMEAATATGERRDPQRAGPTGGIGRGAFASRTGRLLLLLAEVFRRREEEPCNPPGTLPPLPSLDFRRDIAGFLRPVYSLLGEALLGEPGPARRLGSQILLAATALSTAGLDASRSVPQGSGVRDALVTEADATVERRLAVCYAELVVLAMSTKLETFLTAMGTDDEGNVERDGFKHEEELTLADLGNREVEVERLLRGLGVWETHGVASGWPHSAPPPRPQHASTTVTAAEEAMREAEGSELLDAPLPILVARAEGMVGAFRSMAGEANRRWWRRVEHVILARVESCKRLLPEARAR